MISQAFFFCIEETEGRQKNIPSHTKIYFKRKMHRICYIT